MFLSSAHLGLGERGVEAGQLVLEVTAMLSMLFFPLSIKGRCCVASSQGMKCWQCCRFGMSKIHYNVVNWNVSEALLHTKCYPKFINLLVERNKGRDSKHYNITVRSPYDDISMST